MCADLASLSDEVPKAGDTGGGGRRWATWLVAAVLIASVAGLVGVLVSGDDDPTPSASSRPPPTLPMEAGVGPALSPPHSIGEQVRSGNIDLTVTAARESDQYRTDSGRVAAPEGAHYVIVATEVLNNSPLDINLVCGGFYHRLVDDRARTYEPVRFPPLAEIPGNPECGDAVQPGAGFHMMWVYRVPDEANVESFRFKDIGFTTEATVFQVVALDL